MQSVDLLLCALGVSRILFSSVRRNDRIDAFVTVRHVQVSTLFLKNPESKITW